jgi:hypothetical protein
MSLLASVMLTLDTLLWTVNKNLDVFGGTIGRGLPTTTAK